MKFDWKEFYFQAREIYTQRSEKLSLECCMRSVINRAYYSCYCIISDIIKSKFGNIPRASKGGVHERLIAYLKSDQSTFSLGEKLGSMKEKRVNADYFMNNDEDWEATAEEVLTEAEELLFKLIPKQFG